MEGKALMVTSGQRHKDGVGVVPEGTVEPEKLHFVALVGNFIEGEID